MSKKAVYDQLTSSYGEGFPADAAQYAIDNMTGVDWNANALEKAKQYYYNMSMSKSAVYDQLTSEYGEQFTASQAQYRSEERRVGTMVQKGSDNMPEVDVIRAQLFALQDKEYQVFYSRLMPTLPPETVIGVRVPLLRRLAKQLADTPEAEAFLQCLPHFYYEENALHAFLLEPVRDYGTALAATERFLPYVDNWAVCDSFSPKVFAQHKPELLCAIRRWLGSDQVYTVRYGIGMLMRYYLDDAFRPEYLAWVAAVHSEEYYVNMMRAWYFATALAKQPAAALPWLTDKRLDVWTHNKTIQKAVESYRIPPEQKQALRALRIRSQKLCEERRV